MKRYEAMFLFDNTAVHEWAAIEQEVRRLCSRIGAELQACVKFDERKLAYEIRRRKRGTYVLAYFDAPPGRVADLERDVRLSDLVLRALVLRADKVSEERLAELRARPADVPLSPGSGDGRRHDEEPRGRRERGPREPRGQEVPAETRERGGRITSEPVTAEEGATCKAPSGALTAGDDFELPTDLTAGADA